MVEPDRVTEVSELLARELHGFVTESSGPAVEIQLESAPVESAPARPPKPELSVVSDRDDDSRPLRLSVPSRVAAVRGVPVKLTRLEFDLLLFLCERPGQVIGRLELLRSVWKIDYVSTRTVDVHVRRLRRKLGPALDLITTVRGVGYRLDNSREVRIDYDSVFALRHAGRG